MSLSQGLTTQAKYAALGYITAGTLKMALYTGNATLGPSTLVYTTANEVSSTGTGYTAGGQTLTGVTLLQGNGVAYLSFNNVLWSPANFTARGALIYNTSLGNLAVAVLDFGADKTATTTFLVQMPADTSNSAIIRLA